MDVKTQLNNKKAHINEAASDLLDEGMKYANELYEDGLKKIEKTQEEVKVYSDELIEAVRQHPLKAVLIAGGVGLLLSLFMRK